MWFGKRPISNNRPGITDRHRVILPVAGELLDRANHPLWRECRPGWKFPHRFLSGSENFYMGSTYIDNQHIHREASFKFLNPKLESETNETLKSEMSGFGIFLLLSIWICFEFGISDFKFFALARFRQGRALGSDHTQELVPGIDERFGSFVLQPRGQLPEVDSGRGELIEHDGVISTVRRHDSTDLAMIGESLQSSFGHRVHGKRRGKRLHIEDIGGLRVLGSRARPQ